jgi:type IV pilus assembly protein PilW
MSISYSKIVTRRQLGLGLVELMIAATIGLILIGALAYFFLGSREINRSHENVSRMQESGRNALDIMGKTIRQAGYVSNATLISGLASAVVPLNGTNGAADNPDTLTVQYEAGNEGGISCTGAVIAPGVVITQVFAVNTAVTPPTLTCNGSAIVDNVENMQVTYGIDLGRTGIISSYKSVPAANEFSNTAAIRVSLLIKGPEAKLATGKQSYFYNGVAVDKSDGFLRQEYATTFTIRGQAR